MSWLDKLERRAELRARAGLTRNARPRAATEKVVDLAGNDYLGLSRHPLVIQAAAQALHAYGLGATGSRLVRGSTHEHDALEDELAAFLTTDTALVYSSGYLANLGALKALSRRGSPIIIDTHAHASLWDAARLTGAETITVPHNSPAAVAAVVRPGAVVVVESVYSVDGDLAPLAELHRICHNNEAILLVDEAHAIGVIGPAGAGGVVAAGLANAPDLVVTATLSKALGGAGGVVAGPKALRQHLVDTSRTFIFDTALPPAVAAGVRAALAIAHDADDLRGALRQRATLAAELLHVTVPAAGVLSTAASSAAQALAWADGCRAAGVAVGCFRPPSTPDNVSRIRITVNAGIAEHIFCEAIRTVAREQS